MRRVAVDENESFQNDHFLSQLAHSSDAKFTLYEYAQIPERQQKFRSHVSQSKLTLTFPKTGLNMPIVLEWSEDKGEEVEFRSTPIIFNGVWVKLRGSIAIENLEGKVTFEKCEEPPEGEEVEYMTEEQLNELRRRGLQL